ncbi:MAG TPA: hypothetical protein VF384_19575 [Planctomycetota bacterium]
MNARQALGFLCGVLGGVATSYAQRDVIDAVNRQIGAGDVAGAITALDRALAQHRDVAELWWLRSWCKGRTGDLDGGIADASRAIELEPKDARGWCERAYLRRQKRQLDEALLDHDRAIELEPTIASLWGDRADTKKERGDLVGAVADYDKALELEPGFGAALHNRALAFWGLGAWHAVVRDQARAIERSPPMQRMWHILAVAMMHVGWFDDVVESCERGLEVGGEPEPGLRLTLAEANWLRGRGDAATVALAAAIASPEAQPEAVPMLAQRLAGYHVVLGDLESARKHLERAAQAPALRPWVELMRWCAETDAARAAADLQAAFAAISPQPDAGLQSLVRICAGASTAEHEVGKGLTLELQCAAWFLAGWRARRSAEREAAASCFRRSIATGCAHVIQWQLAYAALGLAQQKERPGYLGCSVRAVSDAATPTLEVVTVNRDGPAAVQGVRVGMRVTLVNELPATEAAFAKLGELVVVGTSVRLLVVDGEAAKPLWVGAGTKGP